MSIIVFPGQGSQFVGMSRDFYDNFDSAKHIFSLIQDTTKINIKDIIFENSEGFLDITQYTQLAIFCASMSIYRVFKEEIEAQQKREEAAKDRTQERRQLQTTMFCIMSLILFK